MKKFYPYLTFLVQTFVVALIFGCASVVVSDSVREDYDKYLLINPGDKSDKIEEVFGSSGIYQFSVFRNNEVFSLIEYNLMLAKELDYSETVWIVLRNGEFINLLNPIPYKSEIYYYHGVPASRVISWNIEDEDLVNKVIEKSKEPFSKSYWLKRWEKEVREYSAYLRQKRIDPGLTTLALVVVPFITPTMIHQQHQKDTLFKKYNGNRIRIGMKVEEVDSIFGVPRRSEKVGPSKIAHYYGQVEGLDVQEWGNVPFVAVVFKDDQASGIFSGSFFNTDWIK